MSEREQVRELFSQENTSGQKPPTLEEFPMGGDYEGSLADFSREHLAMKEAGSEYGLLPPDRDDLGVITERPDLFQVPAKAHMRGVNSAFNEVFSNTWISGDTTDMPAKLRAARDMTVQDELVETLIEDYQDQEFKVKQLSTLHELPPDEQLRILNYELNRRDAQKMTAREALLIHVFRAGQHDLTISQFEKLKRTFNPVELDQFRQQLRTQQVDELRQVVDEIVARRDIGTTGEAVGQFIVQDLVPLYNVVSRMVLSNTLGNEVDAEIGWFRSLFPGEVRQEIRERFAAATPAERLQYVEDIGAVIQELKDGEYGGYFTEYGVLENYMEIFTEDLLQENLPKNTLDRVLGNLDVVLEMAFNIGLILKVGGRTTRSAYRANNTVQARRVARAAGNHRLAAKLDRELSLVIHEAGEDAAESSLVHMPKPPTLYDNREILPDDLRELAEQNDRIGDKILQYSDDLTGIGLTTDEKFDVIRRELDLLDSHATMSINPKMSVLEQLPNDSGIKFTAVYGQTPEQGWDNIYDVIDELLEVDPNVENFRILRRNENGELERITLTPDEFARLVTKGEIPKALLPEEPGQRLVAEMINNQPVSTLGDDQLIELSAAVPRGSREWEILNLEARRRANGLPVMGAGDALRAYGGDEFFLEVDHERLFHVIDKEVLGASTWRNTANFISRWLFPPNAQFGDEIFGSFDRAYRIEQGMFSRLQQVYEPFQTLSKSDQRVVQGVMEHIEDFAKRNGRAPTFTELGATYDELTLAQKKGVMALQAGQNIQWQLFNRRLYREFQSKGYRTATPLDDTLPTLHGEELKLEQIERGAFVYNPVTREQVQMTAEEMADFYNSGGSVYKLDMALDIPGSNNKAATLILADPDAYKTGKLSPMVLEYRPGYFTRSYKDPYYIIARTGKEVDGIRTDLVEDALRTARSAEEAERFVRRFATLNPRTGLWVNDKDPSKTYRIQRAADLDQTESTLYAKQALVREGRLFWDKRNFDRLPDVNGNKAELEDPHVALQRSTAMATRQTSQEDLLKQMKLAFGREFKDILPDNYMQMSVSDVIANLTASRRNATEKILRDRYNKAIAFAKYMRLQLGTDAIVVPALREGIVRLGAGLSRLVAKARTPLITEPGFKLSRVIENWGATVDPFRFLRSVAFQMFMVFRPIRQRVLQSMQISFLTAIDPLYIGSGRVFKDGSLLKHGLMARRKSGYDVGISAKKAAQLMGLSKRQYDRLIDEFDRAGLLDTVDVHAFAGGARALRGNTAGVRQVRNVGQWLQTHGFDAGEQSNLAFTYMVALRRYMREAKVDDLMKLKKSQWDEIGTQAQQLALGMTKPNKMWYQTGMWATYTQFLSFSHKALMTVLGANPAISKLDAIKMGLMTYTLFGANMFGAGEWAMSWLNSKGLDSWGNREIPGWGTVKDLIAYGIIQSSINGIFRAIEEEHRDIDLGFAAPGVNALQLYEMLYETAMENPVITAWTGPGGSVTGSIIQNAKFTMDMMRVPEISPADKAVRALEMMGRSFPQYNDIMTGLTAYQTQRWESQAGRVLPVELEPVWTGMIARGLVGARPVEELAWYELSNEVWQTKENMKNVIEANRDYLLKQLSLFYDGVISEEYLREQIQTLASFAEAWPEHLQQEILRQSLILENQEGQSVLNFLAENTKYIKPNITGLLDSMPDLPPGARDELEQFLNEIYDERVKQGTQTMQEELQDSDLWQN